MHQCLHLREKEIQKKTGLCLQIMFFTDTHNHTFLPVKYLINFSCAFITTAFYEVFSW